MVSIVQVLWLVYVYCGNKHSSQDVKIFSCNELQTWSWTSTNLGIFSIGFANGHCKYTCALSSALATIWIDPRKTVLMVPLSLSYYSLEGEDHREDEKVDKFCGDGLLGYGDDEVRVSHVWEEGGGTTGSRLGCREYCNDSIHCHTAEAPGVVNSCDSWWRTQRSLCGLMFHNFLSTTMAHADIACYIT